MPAFTLTTVLIFVLAVAPGFLFIRGYALLGTKAPAERDLYALAEAVAASIVWLALLWLVLLYAGDPVAKWGLVPYSSSKLQHHRTEVAAAGLGIVVAPFVLGVLAGRLALPLARSHVGRWIGAGQPRSSWDHALLATAAIALERGSWVDVTIQMKSGTTVYGRLGPDSKADLFPRPERNLYLEAGYATKRPQDDDEDPELIFDCTESENGGVFVQASEVEIIGFSVAPAAEGRTDAGGSAAAPSDGVA